MASKKSQFATLFANRDVNKAMSKRKTPVYTSESHPIYVDWLVKKYDIKNGNPLVINLGKKDDKSSEDEKKNDKEEDNENILSIEFDLGMTICPGKHQDFAASGCEWKRDLNADLKILKEEFATDVIVSLLSEEDLKDLKVETLMEDIKKNDMKSYWYKIPDGTTPKDKELWKKMVIDVANELTVNKKKVVVHCMGGLNRTGMFVLSILKYLKIIDDNSIDDGVKWIGKSRKGAGGNISQIDYVSRLKF